VQTGYATAHLANLLIVGLLASGHTKPEVEQVVVRLLNLLENLLVRQCSQFLRVLVRHLWSSYRLLQNLIANDQTGLYRQLVRRQAQSLSRQRFIDTGHLEQHAPWFDDSHPVVRRALTAAHAGLRRLCRDGLIRKDTDPHLAAAFHVVRDRTAGSFDLPAVNPGWTESLQPKLAEGDRIARIGRAATVSPVDFAVRNALWL